MNLQNNAIFTTKTSTSHQAPQANARRTMALVLLSIGFLLGVEFWFRTATVPSWLVALSFAGPIVYIMTEMVVEAIRLWTHRLVARDSQASEGYGNQQKGGSSTEN